MSEGTFESAAGDVDGHVKEPVTDDGELEAAGQSEQTEADGPEQDDSGTALDDVDLEPPSS